MIGSLTNIKEGFHDRLSHTNIKEGFHDRFSHTNILSPPYGPPIQWTPVYMDPLWTPYGPPMDPLWTPYVLCMQEGGGQHSCVWFDVA